MIIRCSAADPALRQALADAALPTDDLEDGPASFFSLVAGGGGTAYGGVAGKGPDRLLRSVVVPRAARRGGLGSRIVEDLAAWARGDGARRLWLLTNDSATFFSRLGWQVAAREAAPPAIAATRQFGSICPQSATLMVRQLSA